MDERKKFWLTLVLAVTFPVWIIPAACVLLVCAFAAGIWEAVTALVEDMTEDGEDEA